MQDIVNLPVMAVDLGFGAGKTCGLAWQVSGAEPQVEVLTFARCVERVAQFVSDKPRAVLIVEAPLSGLFDSAGNPKGRVPFERASIGGRTTTRYWYVGAGAAVGLGAVFLFSRLSQQMVSESNVVYVVEGFVSFRTQDSSHSADACALLNSFRHQIQESIHDVKPSAPDEHTVNMLSLAGLVPPEERCPTVIVATIGDVNH
jgi:hypothetical protein